MKRIEDMGERLFSLSIFLDFCRTQIMRRLK